MALVLIIGVMASVVLAQDEPNYLTLEGAGFAGRCNLRFYEHDGSRVDSSEAIRYMVVYILNQAADEESLIMSGNWSANTTGPNGALVMGWESRYGPYVDEEAYEALNCTECTVPPDYFWVTWGLQGDYTQSGRSYSRPYLTLDGVGLGVDWDAEEVLSLGEISLRGRIKITGNTTDPVMVYYKPKIMVQAMQIDDDEVDAPHWNSYKGSAKLNWMETGAGCWNNLLDDIEFICDWLYTHFGIDICPELA